MPGIPVFLQVEPLEMENSKGILKPAQSITFYMALNASQSEGLFYCSFFGEPEDHEFVEKYTFFAIL